MRSKEEGLGDFLPKTAQQVSPKKRKEKLILYLIDSFPPLY